MKQRYNITVWIVIECYEISQNKKGPGLPDPLEIFAKIDQSYPINFTFTAFMPF